MYNFALVFLQNMLYISFNQCAADMIFPKQDWLQAQIT